MTLSLGSEPGSGGGGDWQDTNGDEPSKPKRMRLNEGDQYFVCDFDILGATDCVFSSINVEDVLKEQICKYSRLSSLANMERKFLEIDIAFYRMEYQIQKLKEKKSLEKTSALNIPDVHFFDAIVKVDRNFEIPDPTSPRRPDPPLPTHTPSNVRTLSKASAGRSDEITPVGSHPPVPYNHPPQGPVVHMKLEISSKVLATRTFPLGEFYKARIIQIHEPSKKSKSEPMYLVRPEARKGIPSSLALKWHYLTYGKEQMIVPCVNSIDDTYPTFAEYSSERYAGKGVDLNLDKDFLCGCDCEDDCQDREKCSCQKLTVEATEALASGRNPYAGYLHRRLLEPHITGVYECNSQCHCSRRCFNRVVQNDLRSRLQVFKTEKHGLGIRFLDALPHGTFICVPVSCSENRARTKMATTMMMNTLLSWTTLKWWRSRRKAT
ncbi:hypothetical protein V5799_006533 [Amblyomma americanum]|uniref:Pre-SET domain-containing protein n=1 Tax=Amblyomma americanum TaxID=6943 RepID=A0AAQ4DW53_AMBAM